MLSDAELVKASREGDPTSLGLLLERYRAPLYALALQILGHGQETQDAVHDTFLVALRKIDQVREPAAVGGWLHTVLRNVCRMRLRHGQGEILVDELPRRTDLRASESPVEESIDRLATREWVWTALVNLPEALRVTVMLRYFGSYASYEEISTILGVPVGTVCSRLNQAKGKLAEALLESAGQAHDEARQISESRRSFFEAAYAEYNAGKGYEDLLSAFSEDLVLSFSSGEVFPDGYEFLIQDGERDLQTGTKMHPTDVFSSKEVTIVECDLENSPEDPLHCPPAVSQVLFYRGGRVQRARWHLAPWQRSEDSYEENFLEPLATEAG